MSNRRFSLILVVALAVGVFAQTPAFCKDQFVAVVITGNLPRYKEAHEAFVKILRAGGMGEDKVKVFVQTPNPDAMSWANSIRKAVGVGADLIITYGAPVTLIAKKEVKGVPLLFADVYDPVSLGIVKDLAVTGSDISGVSGDTPLETLVKVMGQTRSTKKIGVLYTASEQGSALQARKIEELGGKFGYSVVKGDVKSSGDIQKTVDALAASADCLYISESVVISQQISAIMTAAAQKSIPVVSQIPGLGDLGALVTLETDPVEQGQLLGVHAIQVLNGQRVFTLPVRSPKRIALVINLHTADKLGIKVPFEALSSATRVIK